MSFLQDIYQYMKNGESETENLGLEIEHFVVDETGSQIPFDEISSLIDTVGRAMGAEIIYVDGHPVGYYNGKYSISLEPACQFEISVNPYSSLAEIESVYREFLSVWEPLFARRGYQLVTKGNLPLVERGVISPDQIPLSPKKRYQYMDAYFRESGKYGKYMMRASASTQISVDYKSEADLIRKLRLLQKISPVLMIMMENKTEAASTLPGVSDRPHLLRIQEWDDLDPSRTGFFPGSFDADFGYQKAADAVYHTPLILLTDNGATIDVGSKTAKDLYQERVISPESGDEARREKLVEHFLSMGFFHFRIKKYIEIRVADSVPIDRAMGYAALLKGIVYSEHNLDALEKQLADVTEADAIQEAVHKIEKDGMQAVIYCDMTAAQWAARLIELARDGLADDEREYLCHV
ncbi:MAG: hypothetical protein IIY71_04040 [Oscillospiraceae bacterium]|nr:hypothetical protein [Oscillospiraceae bacterium]